MTTQWYLDMAKRLDSVTSDLKNGNPVKHYNKLKKLDIAKSVMEGTFVICRALGKSKEAEEAEKASNSLLSMYRAAVIAHYNKIHS